MKRVACLAIPLALCLLAQPSRDAYRNAYRAWRQMDPTLEQDAAKGGAGIDQRAQIVASAAAKYEAERTAFLQQRVADTGKTLSRLETAEPSDVPAASPKAQEEYVAADSVAVGRISSALANDPDKGMQPLRLALEREHVALAALDKALTERQRAADAARDATAVAEQARLKALAQFRQMEDGLKTTLQQTSQETALWSEYYRQLSAPPGAASNAPTAASNVPEPGTLRPLVPSITPVPLVRYTGAWTYPSVNGFYHGPQPEFVDLVVHEQNGRADGTLSARFKLSPGTADDPALLFSFSGNFKETRTQVFDLMTNAGAKGTIELIPGPAFNLLEVNFRIESNPGKIAQGNFLLVKK